MGPVPALLEEIVRRTVECVHPLRIVLFGSAARGELGPDSDLDLLVVVANGVDRLDAARRLHRRLRGLDCAKDIVVVCQEDVERYQDNPYLVVHTALAEGRELYHAA